MLQDERPGLAHGRMVGRVAGELQGEVGLDGGGKVAGAAVPQGPVARRGLLAEKVVGHLPLFFTVHQPHEVEQHDVFGGYGDVGLQLGPPVAGRELLAEEEFLGPLDGDIEGARYR